MEPPAKRAKVGRAPHDAPDVNSNKMNSKTGKKGTGNTRANGDDDDDEIAMDPEDYAMKVDPEYRLDRSRAVADNKLKSAFELLFEKYSQDFGDTGDEINFYTDEIEVDNGHIASLPVERPSKQGGDQDSDDESDEGGDTHEQPALSSAAKASSSRLVASLLPSRFGPGGTVIMGGSAPGVHQGLAPGEIDPTWAAPEIPDAAFSTPGGGVPFVPPPPPPRSAYAPPQRTVFTKTLPTTYGGGLGEDGEDEDDDLILDTPKPMTKGNRGEKSSSGSVLAKQAADEPKSTKKRRKRTSDGPITTDEAKQAANTAPPKSRRSGRHSEKTVIATGRTSVPDSASPEPPLSEVQSSAPLASPSIVDGSSSPTPGSLPTPPDEDGDAGEQSTSKQPTDSNSTTHKETFKRNTLDPSFVFSDDEDFGLKKRKRPQPVPPVSLTAVSQEALVDKAAVRAAPTVDENKVPLEVPVIEKREKKRPGRPRKSSGITEAYTESTVEATEISSLLEAQRREAQSLSIIIMTTSGPPSKIPTPARTATTVEVVTETEVAAPIEFETDSEPTNEPAAEPRIELEPEPEPRSEPESESTLPHAIEGIAEPTATAEPELEPAPEPASEPEVGPTEFITEDAVVLDVTSSTPPTTKAASDKQPRKRKRRRQPEDGSSPLTSSQRSSKSSQKSASSAKSKAGRRGAREIPDSQSLGSSGIISLVSDGSADEAEVDKIAEASPRPFVPGSGGRQPLSAGAVGRHSSQTTPTRSKQTTPLSRRRMTAGEALMATPSRHRSYTIAGRLTPTKSRLLLLSPLARRQQQVETGSAASSPGGSPIQTPGGTLRRCGKDGFRCEREFCFRCT